MKFRRFDPYKEDDDRRLAERGAEYRKATEELRSRRLNHTAKQQALLGLAKRSKRPVTLPAVGRGLKMPKAAT